MADVCDVCLPCLLCAACSAPGPEAEASIIIAIPDAQQGAPSLRS